MRILTPLVIFVSITAASAQIKSDPGSAAARDEWLKTKKKLESVGINFGLEKYTLNQIPDEKNFAAHPLIAESYTLAARDDRDSTRLGKLDLDDLPSFAEGRRSRPKYDAAKLYSLAGLAGDLELDRKTAAEKILEGLSNWGPELDGIVEAARRPDCHFPLDLKQLASSVAHSVPPRITKHLAWRALSRIELGKPSAATDMDAMLRLTNHSTRNQSLLGLLITIAANRQTLMCLREGIAYQRWEEADLARFDQQLAKLDFASQFSNAARFEISYAEHFSLGLITGKLDKESAFGIFAPNYDELPSASEFYGQIEAICRAHLEVLFDGKPKLPCLSTTRMKKLDAFAGESIQLGEKELSGAESARSIMRGFYRAGVRCLHDQAHVNLARIAIALERHRLTHGNFPAKLDALVPEFLSELPVDPITSQPPRYHLKADGVPVIYSFGWDGDDDGGTRPDADNRRKPEADGDWIWQIPTR